MTVSVRSYNENITVLGMVTKGGVEFTKVPQVRGWATWLDECHTKLEGGGQLGEFVQLPSNWPQLWDIFHQI